MHTFYIIHSHAYVEDKLPKYNFFMMMKCMCVCVCKVWNNILSFFLPLKYYATNGQHNYLFFNIIFSRSGSSEMLP